MFVFLCVLCVNTRTFLSWLVFRCVQVCVSLCLGLCFAVIQPKTRWLQPKISMRVIEFWKQSALPPGPISNTVFIGEQARSSAIPAHDMEGPLQEPAVPTTGGLGKDCSGPS